MKTLKVRQIILTGFLALIIGGAVYVKYKSDLAAALSNYRFQATRDTEIVRVRVQQTFTHLYQGLRTIARLPSIRKIAGSNAKADNDTIVTIQEIYNNLASSESVSELYVVLVDFDPDKPNKANGQPHKPIMSFDQLIIGRTLIESSDEKHHSNKRDIDEIEIFEYRAMRSQLKWFKEHFPTEAALKGLKYPALSSEELITCDNTRFDPSHPNDKDRSGLVYSVPFYDENGLLQGIVSGVVLTQVLSDLLPNGSYVIRNIEHDYSVYPNFEGPWNYASKEIEQGETDRDALYSEVRPIGEVNGSSGWILWVSQPDEQFWNRDDVRQVQRFALNSIGFTLIGCLALILFLNYRGYLQGEISDALIQSAADSIVILNTEHKIVKYNSRTMELFGLNREQLVNNEIFNLLKPESRDELRKALLVTKQTQSKMDERPLWTKQLQAVKGDGTEFAIELTAGAVQAGDETMYTAIIRDITQRLIMEVQLRSAQKLESIGQLAAGIAHEINTPMQFVSDNARFLQDEFNNLRPLLEHCQTLVTLGEDTSSSVAIENIKKCVTTSDIPYLLSEIPNAILQSLDGIGRVTKIIRAMKEFSHPGTTVKQAIDINRAIESTVVVSTNEWKYVAEVVLELSPNLPLLPCLPGELNQVILNLIVNAAHAIEDNKNRSSTEKGRITISTVAKDDAIEIAIKDTGGGIPASIADKIFDPFFTTKEVGKGTGQGLALARSTIINKHGGTIDFRTEIGVGTTFLITLPILEADAISDPIALTPSSQQTQVATLH